MVQVVKSEWHQVEKRYVVDIDIDMLTEIYDVDELTEQEIEDKMELLSNGDISPEEIIQDAYNNGVDIDWDWLDEDDWWTDRKGGYQITYNLSE